MVVNNQSRLWDIIFSQRVEVPCTPDSHSANQGIEPEVEIPQVETPPITRAVVIIRRPRKTDKVYEDTEDSGFHDETRPLDLSIKCVIRKRVQCDQCKSWVFNLKQHKKCVHDITAQQICKICGKTFPNRLKVITHQYYRHRPCKYKCNICAKPMRSPGLLNEHVHQKHMVNSFLYSCKLCASKFNYRTSFIIHQKRVHRQEYVPAKKRSEF